MSKKELYKSKILYNLRNSSPNLKKLFTEVTNKTKFTSSDNPFYEALIELLDENKIAISGYDINVHNVKTKRKQSLMKEGIIFELIRTEQTDIMIYFNQLKDPKKIKTAKKALHSCFKKKLAEFIKPEIELYENIKSKVLYNDRPDGTKEWFIDLNIDEATEILGIQGYKPKNPDFTDSVHYPSVKNGKIVKGYTPDQAVRIFSLNESLIDDKGSWSVEDFLEKKMIKKPKDLTDYQLNSIFNRLLFYVNTRENYNAMINFFSWALSDEEDSVEWFKIFMETYNINSLKDFLKKELTSELKTDTELK